MSSSAVLRRLCWAFAVLAAPALAQDGGMTVDFSSVRGAGTQQHKVLIENIRVQVPVANPASPGTFTTSERTYNVQFDFDPATLQLVPGTITQVASEQTVGCATAEVRVFNALVGESAPIANAMVIVGTRTATTNTSGIASLTGLPEGLVNFRVRASGYTTAQQAANLSCSTANRKVIALSPGAGRAGALAAGQFRVVLTWGDIPRDLDSHLTGPLFGSDRFHVYYNARAAGGCGLDVDDTSSYGPETVTCPATSTTTAPSTTTLQPGVYRYSIHHFSPDGTLGTSGASVRLELGDGSSHSYLPPASGWTGRNDVWTVFELTVNSDGTRTVTPVNTISRSDPASVRNRRQDGPLPAGAPEDLGLFRHLTK